MKFSRGFTLVELMMTITVMAIVLATAAPSFLETIRNNRLSAQTNQATSMLVYARSEAAKRKSTVTVCVSANQSSCAVSSSWENGWIIMSDVDADRVLDAGTDEVLQVGLPLDGGNTLRTSGFANNSYIQFFSTGIPDSTGTVTICDSRGASYARGIVISAAGQSRLAVDENNDRIVNDHTGAGNNVSCP